MVLFCCFKLRLLLWKKALARLSLRSLKLDQRLAKARLWPPPLLFMLLFSIERACSPTPACSAHTSLKVNRLGENSSSGKRKNSSPCLWQLISLLLPTCRRGALAISCLPANSLEERQLVLPPLPPPLAWNSSGARRSLVLLSLCSVCSALSARAALPSSMSAFAREISRSCAVEE